LPTPYVTPVLRLASLQPGFFDRMKRLLRGVETGLLELGFVLGCLSGTQLAGQTAQFEGAASNVNFGGIMLSDPLTTAVDSLANVYVADRGNNRVVEVTRSGVASVLSTESLMPYQSICTVISRSR